MNEIAELFNCVRNRLRANLVTMQTNLAVNGQSERFSVAGVLWVEISSNSPTFSAWPGSQWTWLACCD